MPGVKHIIVTLVLKKQRHWVLYRIHNINNFSNRPVSLRMDISVDELSEPILVEYSGPQTPTSRYTRTDTYL